MALKSHPPFVAKAKLLQEAIPLHLVTARPGDEQSAKLVGMRLVEQAASVFRTTTRDSMEVEHQAFQLSGAPPCDRAVLIFL